MRFNKLPTKSFSLLGSSSQFLSFLAMIFLTTFAHAKTIEDLVGENKLEIKSRLLQDYQPVPGEQLALEVELISYYPFSDNMKVSFTDIAETVLIPPGDQTKLENINRDGRSWFVQRQKISIYPLRSGKFTIPPIAVELFINLDNQERVSGTILSPSLSFNCEENMELSKLDNYLAAPKLSISRKVKGDNKEALDIGSAVTLQYSIKANNLHSIMLPEIEPVRFSGVQTYPQAPTKKDNQSLLDSFNSSSFEQDVTLIFQEEGSFVIPEKKYYWWDTESKKLKEIVLEKLHFKVGSGGAVQDAQYAKDKQQNGFQSKVYKYLIMVAIIILLGMVLHRLKYASWKLNDVSKQTQKQLKNSLSKQFIMYLDDEQYHRAVLTLNQLAKVYSPDRSELSLKDQLNDDANSVQLLERLISLAYCENKSESTKLSRTEAAALIKSFEKFSHRAKNEGFKFKLDLN